MRTSVISESSGNGERGDLDAGLIDLIKVGGLSVGAVIILIKLIDFLRWFLDQIPDALKEFGKSINDFAKSIKTITDTQQAHDQQIIELQGTTNATLADLKTVIVSHNETVKQTVKSYQTLEEQFVTSYDATSQTIGITGLDIKKNADQNTRNIIDEVHKLPTAADIRKELEEPFLQIRSDIGKLIDPELATRVVSLIKPDVVDLIETALKTCLDENAKLAKDLDHADKVIDNIVKPQPPDPDPTPPDHKAAIPGDFEPVAALPKTGTEN